MREHYQRLYDLAANAGVTRGAGHIMRGLGMAIMAAREQQMRGGCLSDQQLAHHPALRLWVCVAHEVMGMGASYNDRREEMRQVCLRNARHPGAICPKCHGIDCAQAMSCEPGEFWFLCLTCTHKWDEEPEKIEMPRGLPEGMGLEDAE